MKVVVYGLSSSENGVVRYIGQTRNSTNARLKAHIQEALRANYPKTYKCFWIRKVFEEGHHIIITTLVPEAVHNKDEKLMIASYRALGFDLVNATDGGDNAFDLSPEARKKMSDRRKGKKLSEETKAKLKELRAKRIFTEETREKLRKAKQNNPVPLEVRQKISKTLKEKNASGKGMTTEARQNLSAAVKKWWDEKKSIQDIAH